MGKKSKYIDADALMDELNNQFRDMDNNVYDSQDDALEDAEVSVRQIIYNMPAADVEPMERWISVDERLPENANDRDTFRPKYQIYTSFGITEGWYGWSGDTSGWYALIWFMDGRYEEWNIDFERGDEPKVAFIPDGGKVKVYAWREFPEPPKMDGGSE